MQRLPRMDTSKPSGTDATATELFCFTCDAPAAWLIRIAGEDEAMTEEVACSVHARGHWHRALLTPPASDEVPERAPASSRSPAGPRAQP